MNVSSGRLAENLSPAFSVPASIRPLTLQFTCVPARSGTHLDGKDWNLVGTCRAPILRAPIAEDYRRVAKLVSGLVNLVCEGAAQAGMGAARWEKSSCERSTGFGV